MKTLAGLLPDNEHATHAREALTAAGIRAGGIRTLVQPADVWEQLEGHHKRAIVYRYAAAGAAIGLVVGGLYGIPAGIMNCAETGCPMTTSTALLAIISVYWVLGGAFIGAIIGADRLEQDLYSYVQGVRRGQSLLVVDTPDERADTVTRLLRGDGGLLVHAIDRDS